MGNIFEKTIERLNELRGSENVSAFARRLGFSQKGMDNYLKGERRPTVELLLAACVMFHVSADWLLGLSDNRDGSDSRVSPRKKEQDAEKNTNVPKCDECTRIMKLQAQLDILKEVMKK